MKKNETFSEYIKRLRPIDDALVRALTIPGPRGRMWVQNVLRIILGWPDLVVLEIVPQAELWLPGTRGATFDVLATDSKGRKYDIEVQINPAGATLYRARYHCSLIDVTSLAPKEYFTALPEIWSVFICASDPFGYGDAKYEFETICRKRPEIPGDGRHIVFANAEYRDDSEFGKLMEDFLTDSSDKMRIPWMRNDVEFLKESPEGEEIMDAVLEELFAERAKEHDRERDLKKAEQMLALGADADFVAKVYPDIPVEIIKDIQVSREDK